MLTSVKWVEEKSLQRRLRKRKEQDRKESKSGTRRKTRDIMDAKEDSPLRKKWRMLL